MKLLISRRLPDAVLDAAGAKFDMTFRDDTAPMSQAECVAALRDYDAILPTLGDAFTADAFAEVPVPRCRILANFGVGYNHINVAGAREAGVVVTNTPGVVTDATADIGVTLLLMSARRAGEGERLARSGTWSGWNPTQMLGSHVTGKVLGVVGMGRIGQAIARRCHFGFRMQIVYFNRSPVAPRFPARQLDSLTAVMSEADFVIIAVPGGAETRYLIDANALAAMQRHAHLINVSRGDVIDETALIAALQSRRIGGAGLDVYEREPLIPEALRALDNVTLLPHLGTAALEVRVAMGLLAVENLRAIANGKVAPNAI